MQTIRAVTSFFCGPQAALLGAPVLKSAMKKLKEENCIFQEKNNQTS